jgi:hypothetical protein
LNRELDSGLLWTSGRGRILSLSFVGISIYLAYLRLELIYGCHSVCCGLTPSHREFFLVTELATPLGNFSLLGLVGDFSL